MKGLVLVHMGRREEGIDLVKKGVRLDLTSHIVWHVFGLVQKGEKNYEEALKSYSQALRFDKVRSPSILDRSTRLQRKPVYLGEHQHPARRGLAPDPAAFVREPRRNTSYPPSPSPQPPATLGRTISRALPEWQSQGGEGSAGKVPSDPQGASPHATYPAH